MSDRKQFEELVFQYDKNEYDSERIEKNESVEVEPTFVDYIWESYDGKRLDKPHGHVTCAETFQF